MVIAKYRLQPFQLKPAHRQGPLAKSSGFLLCGLKDFSTEAAEYSLCILRSYLACPPVYLISNYYLNYNSVLSIYLFFWCVFTFMKPCLISRPWQFEYCQYKTTGSIRREHRKRKARVFCFGGIFNHFPNLWNFLPRSLLHHIIHSLTFQKKVALTWFPKNLNYLCANHSWFWCYLMTDVLNKLSSLWQK